MSDEAEKTRENRLRRKARRRGLELQRFRTKDRGHLLYGTYHLLHLPSRSVYLARKHPVFGRQYGLTLDEVAKALGEGEQG